MTKAQRRQHKLGNAIRNQLRLVDKSQQSKSDYTARQLILQHQVKLQKLREEQLAKSQSALKEV